MAIYSTDLTYCDMSFKTHSIGIHDVLKALSHQAIFLATCLAIWSVVAQVGKSYLYIFRRHDS